MKTGVRAEGIVRLRIEPRLAPRRARRVAAEIRHDRAVDKVDPARNSITSGMRSVAHPSWAAVESFPIGKPRHRGGDRLLERHAAFQAALTACSPTRRSAQGAAWSRNTRRRQRSRRFRFPPRSRTCRLSDFPMKRARPLSARGPTPCPFLAVLIGVEDKPALVKILQ